MKTLVLSIYLLASVFYTDARAAGGDLSHSYLLRRLNADQLLLYTGGSENTDNGASERTLPVEVTYFHRFKDREVKCFVESGAKGGIASWEASARSDAYLRQEGHRQTSSDHFPTVSLGVAVAGCSPAKTTHRVHYWIAEFGGLLGDTDEATTINQRSTASKGLSGRFRWLAPIRSGSFEFDAFLNRRQTKDSSDWAYGASAGLRGRFLGTNLGTDALARHEKRNDDRYHTIPSIVLSASKRLSGVTLVGLVQREILHDQNGTYVEIGFQYGLGIF